MRFCNIQKMSKIRKILKNTKKCFENSRNVKEEVEKC